MIYSSTEFIVLLILTAVLLRNIDSSCRKWVLVLSSSIFILWSDLVTILVLCAVVYAQWVSIKLTIRYSSHAHLIRNISIFILLINLGLWKYWGWISVQASLCVGSDLTRYLLTNKLPIGISFYTLQGIAFLLDNSKGDIEDLSFSNFILFQTFFGQLIAGPIVKHYEMLPQIQDLRKSSEDDILAGTELFALGLFKKLVLADRVAQIVDPIFASPNEYDPMTLLMSVLLYSVQIWGDFSGYMDMGRGAAKICGIELPHNFYAPYLSVNFSDFWRRWHITLGRWLRDYVYLPLGGSRVALGRTLGNLMFTMTLCGIWHGASWNFLLWGSYHGALLVVHRLITRLKLKIPRVVGISVTFVLIAYGWMIFRITDVDTLMYFAGKLFNFEEYRLPFTAAIDVRSCAFLGVTFLIQAAETTKQTIRRAWIALRLPVRGGLVGMLMFAAFYMRGTSAPFIYFAF